MIMKLIIQPISSSSNLKLQVQDLQKYLRRGGFKFDLLETKPGKGELGRGIATGLATILTGGETIFSRLGEALVKYVEGRRVDLTMKNTKGEELVLSAALPKDQIRSLINEFYERNIAKSPKKTKTERSKNVKKSSSGRKAKTSTKKSDAKVASGRKSTRVKKTTK